MPRRSRASAVALALCLLTGGLFTVGSPVDAAPAATSTARSHQFPDVNDANIFHDAIDFMVDEGFVTGYADGMYHPLDMVSRQAFVTVLDPHICTRGEAGRIVMTVLGMVAQMERRFIKERQREVSSGPKPKVCTGAVSVDWTAQR